MYELKTNTAVRIPVGPLVDPSDGKTAETALTVTALTVDILQTDGTGGGAVTRTSFSPTASGGSNDMIHISSDAVGMYDLELTATQLNWYGPGRIVFYDVDGFLVHWIDILVVSAQYYNTKYGTTLLDTNVTHISGDRTAADNCELMFNGTGYAGGTTKFGIDVVNWKGSTAPAMTGDAYARLGSPSGASVSADILDLHTDIGTAISYVDTEVAAIKTTTDKFVFTVANKVDSNVYTWNGTAVSTPSTAGIPEVNVKKINNVATTSVTTVSAYQGTTQPINFTGTGASAYAKSDVVDIAGSAVATGSAQLGVNLVNIAGAAVNTASAQLGVNAVQIGAAVPGSATIGTVTNLTNAPTAGDLTSTMKTSVQTACDAALVAENLDHLCKTATAGVDMTTEVTDGSIISRIISNSDTSLFVPATSNLTTLKSVVDNLHDTDIPDIHTDLGTAIGYIDTEVAAIKTTTDKFVFTVANKVDSNVYTWNGTAVATPATAGVPDINVKNINNVATTSVTTVSAYQGTTQPVNFTGTGASAYAKSDVVDIAGAAVNTSSAQIGVNLINISGSAVNTSSAQLGVNIVNAAGTAWGSGAITAAAVATDAVTEIADGLLNRDMSAVTVTNTRSPINALRFLRNKWVITGTSLSVKKEDDSTEAWAATLTQDSEALPVTACDPS